MAAWRGFLVLLFGLGLAALLDAEGLRKQAETQPAGVGRTLAMDVTRPLVSVSRALHLTTPRHAVQVAIGRIGQYSPSWCHGVLRPLNAGLAKKLEFHSAKSGPRICSTMSTISGMRA